MMAPTLLDEAKALLDGPGGRCAVSSLAESDPKLYAELVEALASDVSHAAIARALKARGRSIGQQSISRHRNGVCRCR